MADRCWKCDRCGVSVRYLPGRNPPPQPAGWEQTADGWHCLNCRRSAAVEAVFTAAEVDADDPAARRLRRNALVDFELTRCPTASNAGVGRIADIPPRFVAERRRELVEQGVIERQKPGPKPAAKPAAKPKPKAKLKAKPAKQAKKPTAKPKPRRANRPTELQQRIGVVLKDDPQRTDKALAADLGCSHATVAARRKALEQAGEIPVTARKGYASTARRSSPRVAARGGS